MNSMTGATSRKRRPASACEYCRRKKIRCNGGQPCENCARTKDEPCFYGFRDEAAWKTELGRTKSSMNDIFSEQVLNLGPGFRHSRTNPETDSGEHFDSSAKATYTYPATDFTSNRQDTLTETISLDLQGIPDFDVQVPFLSKSGVGQQGTGDPRVNTSAQVQPDGFQQLGGNGLNLEIRRDPSTVSAQQGSRLRGVFAYNRFFGPSHHLNCVYQFPDIYCHIFDLEQNKSNYNHPKYAACKALAETNKAIPPAQQANLRDQIPPQHIADKLVQAYLRTFESVFRVLHVPTFLEECSDYFANLELARDEFLITLMLVMAIGIGFCPEVTGWNAHAWIHSAQAWLGPSKRKHASIPGVQITCLLLLARQSNNVEADVIVVQVGALLHLAMQTGLHVDPSLLPATSFYDQEIRRRLWATVLEIMLQSAMDSGGLPLLSIEDADCKVPLNIPDELFDQDTQTSPHTARPLDVFTRTSAQITLMESFPLRLQIAGLVNNIRHECPFERVVELSSKLTALYQTSTTQRRQHHHKTFLDDSATKPESLDFCSNFLDLLTLRFLLALHQPYLMRTKSDLNLYYSRKVSLEVSFCLLTGILATSPSCNPTTTTTQGETDYCRLATTGSGMFRDVPSQAAITVCEDLISHLEEGGVFPTTSILSSVTRSRLESVIEEYRALLTRRLRTNENSVRGYMLFTGFWAKACALQARRDVQQEISGAMKKGLDHCYQVLKARVSEQQGQPVPEVVLAPENSNGSDGGGVVDYHEASGPVLDDMSVMLDEFNTTMQSNETNGYYHLFSTQ